MIQEENQLLLIDLCVRLPYGVKMHLNTSEYGELIGTLDAVYPTEERIIVDNLDKAIAPINIRCGGFKIEENKVKPYLRPMSSMTEEEKQMMDNLWKDNNNLVFADPAEVRRYKFYDISVVDFLNAHHFDYRGLIEKGLAIKTLKGMYE